MSRKEFEKLVREALRTLPKRFKQKLENVDIVVQVGSPKGKTMGLYEGVPLGERDQGYTFVLPDKITLFMRPIEAECEAHGLDIRKEIQDVIRHEIAHHFGIPDKRLEDLDVY